MAKILVDTPQNTQEVIEVGEGGGYFDPARVLWDERADGDMPQITLGGMVMLNGALSFSNDRLAVHEKALEKAAKPAPLAERLVSALVAKGILTEADASKLKEVKK